MSESPQTGGGLLGSAKQMLQTASQLLESRVELFLLELKEERVRLVAALLLALTGGICVLMTLVLVTFTIVVVFWDNYRT
ncbi:MAG: phage holin family protein, partial [Limisphaerales bacterium]